MIVWPISVEPVNPSFLTSPHTPIGYFLVMARFLFGLALLIGMVLPSILSHQPAKYLQVAMDIPIWVLRARV